MADEQRGERVDWLVIDDVATEPDEDGEQRFVAGAFHFKDALGTFNPRSGGGGITEAEHKVLRQLIHFIDEGPAEGFASLAFKETLPSGDPFPISIIWWTSSAKTNKIVEKTITRNPNKSPSTIEWKMYSAANVLLATVTDAISYSGPFETTRTRTIV